MITIDMTTLSYSFAKAATLCKLLRYICYVYFLIMICKKFKSLDLNEYKEKMRLVAAKNRGKKYKPKTWWTDLGDWVPYALAWSKDHKELDVLKDPSALP